MRGAKARERDHGRPVRRPAGLYTRQDGEVAIDAGFQECRENLWTLPGANYTIMAMINAAGYLAERYEYTPYGERTVYLYNAWRGVRGDMNGDGVVDTWDITPFETAVANMGSYHTSYPHLDGYARADVNNDGVVDASDTAGFEALLNAAGDTLEAAPTLRSQRNANGITLNEFGHQGLMHDEEIGLIHNRARTLHPGQRRFMQRDQLGYVDGMGLYEYVGSNPVNWLDTWGFARLTEQDALSELDHQTRTLIKKLQMAWEGNYGDIARMTNDDALRSRCFLHASGQIAGALTGSRVKASGSYSVGVLKDWVPILDAAVTAGSVFNAAKDGDVERLRDILIDKVKSRIIGLLKKGLADELEKSIPGATELIGAKDSADKLEKLAASIVDTHAKPTRVSVVLGSRERNPKCGDWLAVRALTDLEHRYTHASITTSFEHEGCCYSCIVTVRGRNDLDESRVDLNENVSIRVIKQEPR